MVLFVDGFDVLFQTGPEEILQRFQQTNQHLLFAGDHSCFPFKYWPDNAGGVGRYFSSFFCCSVGMVFLYPS